MDKIEIFTAQLLATKSELDRRLVAITKDIRNETNPVSRDSGEQAIERENDEVIDALGESARQEIEQINNALARIENGAYFHCATCGEEIGEARLHSIPYTNLCVSCAEEKEHN